MAGCCYGKGVGGDPLFRLQTSLILLFWTLSTVCCAWTSSSVSLSGGTSVTASFPGWVHYCFSTCSLSSPNLSSLICICLLSWSIGTCSSMFLKTIPLMTFRKISIGRGGECLYLITLSYFPLWFKCYFHHTWKLAYN